MAKEYSEAEKAEFRAKDKRIAREAVLKPVIDKLTDFDELKERKQEVTQVSEYLVDYVYNGLQNGVGGDVAATKDPIDWVGIAEKLNIDTPNTINIKILDLIISEYKQTLGDGEVFNPADILTHILERFGRYPTKQESVSTVVDALMSSKP